MKRGLLFLGLMVLSSTVTITVLAVDCGNYFQSAGADTTGPSGFQCPDSFWKSSKWTIYFTDSTAGTNPPVEVKEFGDCFTNENDGQTACVLSRLRNPSMGGQTRGRLESSNSCRRIPR